MCEKCYRKGKKAKLSRGKIRFFANYIDKHKFADIPLFSDSASNYAIEGELWKIRRRKTFRRRKPPEE